MIMFLLPSLFRIALSKSMPATRSPFNSVSLLAKVNIRHVVPFRSAPPWIALRTARPLLVCGTPTRVLANRMLIMGRILAFQHQKNYRLVRQQESWETVFISIILLYYATMRRWHCVLIVDMIRFVMYVEFWSSKQWESPFFTSLQNRPCGGGLVAPCACGLLVSGLSCVVLCICCTAVAS